MAISLSFNPAKYHSSVSLKRANPFLILPPNILGMILSWMDNNIVENIQTLMSVDSRMKDCLTSAARHITRMIASRSLMLDMFTGLKNLSVEDKTPDKNGKYPTLKEFSKSIWGRMEILFIPVNAIKDIPEFLSSPTFELCHPEESEHCLNQDELYLLQDDLYSVNDYYMPNLRSLTITHEEYKEDEYKEDEYTQIHLNSRIFPRLKNLILNGCILSNVEEFKTLDILSVGRVMLDVDMLKNLNIAELSLIEVQIDKDLDIQSLKKLTLAGDCSYIGGLDNLKITELSLICAEFGYILDLDFLPLRKLTIVGNYLFKDLDIRSLNKLMLHELTLETPGCSNPDKSIYDLNIPYLRSLKLKHIETVTFDKLPNLESLSLEYSTLNIKNPVMKNLTNLNIVNGSMEHLNINLGITVNKQTCPNLRFLNTYGYVDLSSIMKNMPEIVVSHVRSRDILSLKIFITYAGM